MYKVTTRRVMSVVIAAVGALAVLALGACGSDDNDDGGSAGDSHKIFAFSPFPGDFNDVTRAWFNGFEEGAAEAGVEFEAKATSRVEDNTAAYLSFIRSALVEQPDGIVVIPYNTTELEPGLQKIIDDGTPVVIMDQVPGLDGEVSYVGADNLRVGELAAEWMVEQYESGDMQSNKVGILRSAPGITSTDDRLTGFKQGLDGSELTIASELTPNDLTAAEGRVSTVDMLSAQPDLGGIFTVTDILGLGAAEALRDRDKLDVLLASIDASKEGVEAIIDDGAIDASVGLELFGTGKESVLTLATYLDGEDVPPVVDTGATVVSSDNATEYLRQATADTK